MGKILNGAGVGAFFRGPRGLIAGLLIGVGLSVALRAAAQQQPPGQPAPPPPTPAARFQISAADPGKIFVLDHPANTVYVFSTNNQGVWEAREGFAITPEIDRFQKRTPSPRVGQ